MYNEFERELLRSVRHIERLLEHGRFSLRLESSMAIVDGKSGTFTAVLLLNGQPYTAPEGSTYQFEPTFSADDADATLTPNGTSVVVAVPSGSTDTEVTVTATAVAPDGTTLTATDTQTVTEPQIFTLGLSQTA